MALEKLGAVFNQVSMPLQYTPRKFVIHPDTNKLVLIESDHNAYTEDTKKQRKQQMAEVGTGHRSGLVQNCGNSNVIAMVLPQSCAKPPIWNVW